jgi:cob(I)alamin adenosyltransferase
MMDKPRILLFTGNGKGKTTAALGMVLRAVGHGMTSAVIQFIKNDSSTGEIVALRRLGVEVYQGGKGFLPSVDSPAYPSHHQAAHEAFSHASGLIRSGRVDLIVLDELCTAIARGLVKEQDVRDLLAGIDPQCVIVLTGRDASAGLIAMADTVSTIHCEKHGFDSKILAQKGVEF